MNLFIDLETIPSQHPEALAAVRAALKPPGTLKKPESIAAWWESEADTAAAETWRKQALDGGTHGEIVSIAVVSEDGQEWVRCRNLPGHGDTEAALLSDFIAVVEEWTRQEAARVVPNHPDAWPIDNHFLIAHNATFDVPYVWRRCIVNRVPVPPWLPSPAARVGQHYGCTMLAWAGYGNRVSLDSLCKALGVDSPKAEGMDGGKVFDAWLLGEHGRIAAYNLADAKATAECWHILQGRGRV